MTNNKKVKKQKYNKIMISKIKKLNKLNKKINFYKLKLTNCLNSY